MTADNELPSLEGVMNFREFGGLRGATGTVKRGHVFRSGHLGNATDADLEALSRLGIATIVDFRNESDLEADGADRIPEGSTHVSLPLTDPAGRGPEIRETVMSGDAKLIEERYGDGRAHKLAREGAVGQAIDPEKRDAYSGFLRHVATTHRRPVLFHCSAGKDRAGWAATLLGMALGVSDDDLVEHYLLSNTYRPPGVRQSHFESMGIDASLLMPFLGVHEDYLRASFEAIDERWATRERYLEEAMQFTPADAEALRSDLLE